MSVASLAAMSVGIGVTHTAALTCSLSRPRPRPFKKPPRLQSQETGEPKFKELHDPSGAVPGKGRGWKQVPPPAPDRPHSRSGALNGVA